MEGNNPPLTKSLARQMHREHQHYQDQEQEQQGYLA
jgi:hypothetical protein